MDPTNRKTAIAIGAILVLAFPFYLLLKQLNLADHPGEVSPLVRVEPPPGWQPPRTGANGTSVSDLQPHTLPPAKAQPERISVPAVAAAPSVVVDVYEPAKVLAAVRQNVWMKQTLEQPLGQGFIGPWAGFWGTRGEDVAASFKGEVFDYVAEQLLSAPAQVIWFGGTESTSTPVVVVPRPASGAQAAFDALTHAAGRGTQLAERCPGQPDFPDGGAPPAHEMKIQRWVLANQAIYASDADGKLALARNPTAVVQGLCAKLDAPARTPGADLEVRLAPGGLGHDAQLLATLFGLGPSARLAFGVEGDHLVPRGIAGELAEPGRVDVAPLSDELLKAIPVDAPVLLTAQLKLPEKLDPQTLNSFFTKKYQGPTATRQVALVWVPRGRSSGTPDVAVLWGRAQDADALHDIFDGANVMVSASVCNQLVYASNRALLEKLQRACDGKTPSLANAAGPVVAGLRQPASLGLSVQLGALLSGVTLDGWQSDGASHKDAPLPPELEAARRQLEQLPTFGLTGTAQGNALVAGGFHS